MGQYLDKVLALAQAAGPLAEEAYEDKARSLNPDAEEAGEDWDEAHWDEVRSHLEQESPWFKQVMAGESPGDPEEASPGWRERGDELARGELSNVRLTPHTAEASTVPKPTRPPGGPGLFHIKGRQLPPYVQHLWHHLRSKYGDHRAYGMAIGIVKKWASGVNPGGKGKGHKVHSDVQAAAAKNVAQWEKDKADAHAHGHSKGHGKDDKAETTNTALGIVLAAVRGYDREEHGRLEHVGPYENFRHAMEQLPARKPFHKNIVFDFDGTLTDNRDGEFSPRAIDVRGIQLAHQRGYSVAVVSAWPRQGIVDRLRDLGFDAVLDTAPGREFWHGGEDGKQIIVTGNKVSAAAYIDDKAVNHQPGDDWGHTLDQVDRLRAGFIPEPQADLDRQRYAGNHGVNRLHGDMSLSRPQGGILVYLAAPAAWPSGKPYKESLLPPGPTTNALLQGSPLRTGVITNGPGTKPVGVGQLRQAPSQTVAAGPPLPPDVGLPEPADLIKLAGTVQDGADPSMAEGVRKHLRDAAHKLSVDDPIAALHSLRSAQTGVHAAYRSAVAANAPNVATVYGSVFKIPPAAQSSATDQMMAGREVTDHYRALHHQIATHIDRFRRTWFHGQYQHMPEARFSGLELTFNPSLMEPVGGFGASRLVSKFDALPTPRRSTGGMGRVHEYVRKEHGRLQEVASYDRLAEDIRGTARSIPDARDDPRPEYVRGHLNAAARALSNNDTDAAINHLVSAHTTAYGGQAASLYRGPVSSTSDIPVPDRIIAHLHAVKASVGMRPAGSGKALVKFSALERVLAAGILDPGQVLSLTEVGEMELTEVHPYEREAFGRIVHVRNYVRKGSTEPYSGTLMGHEADEAIHKGEAIGEYGEPTGFFKTSTGQRMWGWYGAAGLLVRHTDEQGTKRYLLQKRSPYVEMGNTWSTPGGAIEHVNGVPETPEAAARREATEEFGSELPEGTKLASINTKTFGEGPGAWSYHTVVMDAPHMFNPEGDHATTSWESRGYKWATPEEMADMPLHPHFRATAEELGMPKGGGQHAPDLTNPDH